MGTVHPDGGREHHTSRREGRVIPFGKYLLLDRLAVGGMAEVYVAKSLGAQGFEKLVALKRILPAMAEDNDFIEMFVDEARIAGQLNHPHIAPIYELGKIGESHYIAMEYVWGKDLLQVMNRFRRLGRTPPPAMAAWIASAMCDALHYAHNRTDESGRSLEIIHRDVSPQNVLLSYEGDVKLIDFGIAKAASRTTRTQVGVLKGKFGYMSPEQVKGQAIDHRSDLFAVGTCLYELLVTDRLFKGASDFSTLDRVRKARVPALSARLSSVPAELEQVVTKALAANAAERFQSAAEFRNALQRFLGGTHPPFHRDHLARWMRSAFAEEISTEQARMEAWAGVGQPLAAESSDLSSPHTNSVPTNHARTVVDEPGSPRDDRDGTDPSVDDRFTKQHPPDFRVTSSRTPIRAHSPTGARAVSLKTTAILPPDPMAPAPPEMAPLPELDEEATPAGVTTFAPALQEELSPPPSVEVPRAAPAATNQGPRRVVSSETLSRSLLLALAAVGMFAIGAAGAYLAFRTDSQGAVEVRTIPPVPARIRLDGTDHGVAPVRIQGLETGSRMLEVAQPGYRTVKRPIQVEKGAVAMVEVMLERTSATQGGAFTAPQRPDEPLAQPKEATTTTPPRQTARPSAQRRNAQRARRAAAAKRAQRARSTPSARTRSRPSAQATVGFGRLSIFSNTWARIIVDGRDTGKNTPIRSLRIPAGTHRISLRRPSGRSRHYTVHILRGETTRLSATLPP